MRRDKDVILRLCRALVRPHLKKDVGVLEGVQIRAIRIIRGLGKLNYKDRLRRCQLTTREKQREPHQGIQNIIRKGRPFIQRLFETIKRASIRL